MKTSRRWHINDLITWKRWHKSHLKVISNDESMMKQEEEQLKSLNIDNVNTGVAYH